MENTLERRVREFATQAEAIQLARLLRNRNEKDKAVMREIKEIFTNMHMREQWFRRDNK